METHEVFFMVQNGQLFENFKISLPINQLLDKVNEIHSKADGFCRITEDVYDEGEADAETVIGYFVTDDNDTVIGYYEHYETLKSW